MTHPSKCRRIYLDRTTTMSLHVQSTDEKVNKGLENIRQLINGKDHIPNGRSSGRQKGKHCQQQGNKGGSYHGFVGFREFLQWAW